MKIGDKDRDLPPGWYWAIAIALFFASLPIVWLYDSYKRGTAGIFACAAIVIMIMYALQYPRYFRTAWIYVYITSLSLAYIIASLLIPFNLPNSAPSSAFLWPYCALTIGLDVVIMRLFAKFFDNRGE